MTAVRLEHIHKSFGENEVLKGIDLELADHEVVCLIGASGSGKSTLLRCINLLERVDEGTIVVDGQTITNGKVDVNATFNYTAYLAAAVLFVAITIPLTRLTDWLVARDRRRRQVAGVA